MRKLLLGLIIVLEASPLAGQSVRAGIEAWQKGDATAAVEIWRPLAQKGDADAAFNLGQAYRLGKGVPLDLAKAQGWLDQAARKGHLDAQTTLGLLLFQNGNRTAAMRWLKQAAEAGEPRALLMFGTALYNGDGVTPDPVKAYAYVSRAAAQGLAPAQATLADMDERMSLEQRQKGVAMAKAMIAGKKPTPPPSNVPKSKATKPSAPKTAETKTLPATATSTKVPPASGGKWRIQLGAFSQRKSAEALYARLSAKLDGRQAHYVSAGPVVRLQAGPFESRTAASAACARLAPQPCFPVEGR